MRKCESEEMGKCESYYPSRDPGWQVRTVAASATSADPGWPEESV